MNKIISTDVRLFMCICGSSGSGKTNLIFNLLTDNSDNLGFFQPRLHKIVYFYRYWQPIYDRFLREVPGKVFFQNCLYSKTNNTSASAALSADHFKNSNKENSSGVLLVGSLIDNLLDHQSAKSGFQIPTGNDKVLAIFDDSCEEILESSSFAKLATAGRHKGVSVIFIKHNLYQQGKYCVTVDKNTTHLVILKSPRISKQLKMLGSELEFADANFVQLAYQQATVEPYGHLLIDLSPTCHDALRFCTHIYETDAAVWKHLTENAHGNTLGSSVTSLISPTKKTARDGRNSILPKKRAIFFVPKKVLLRYGRRFLPSNDRTVLTDSKNSEIPHDHPIIPFASLSSTSTLYSGRVHQN